MQIHKALVIPSGEVATLPSTDSVETKGFLHDLLNTDVVIPSSHECEITQPIKIRGTSKLRAAGTVKASGVPKDYANRALLDAMTAVFTVALEQAINLSTSFNHSHSNELILAAITAAYTTTEASKLAGIQNGATHNTSDAVLLARAFHTGVQPLSTISDAGTAAAKDVPAVIGSQATWNQVVMGNDPRLVNNGILRSWHSNAGLLGWTYYNTSGYDMEVKFYVVFLKPTVVPPTTSNPTLATLQLIASSMIIDKVSAVVDSKDLVLSVSATVHNGEGYRVDFIYPGQSHGTVTMSRFF